MAIKKDAVVEVVAIEESQDQKFARLADKRQSEVLHGLKLLGNLAHKGNYGERAIEGELICDELASAVESLRQKFIGESAEARPKVDRFAMARAAAAKAKK